MTGESPRDQLQAALGDAYTLERELGGGGMSHVFVATERALGRQVVVKLLPVDMSGQVSMERFKREIALAARLQHPHIVPLLTAGDAAGLPYFTMPLVEGESLRARLVKQGEFPLNAAVRLLREIAAALAYAHERGIVHRDIKPDNVLLSAGSAMITDFGVAKALSASSNSEAGSVTSLGIALGTPAYMAPEQASADPAVDHRADIYAFGVLAYELLTGQPPFVGRSPQNLLAAHVTESPEPITKRRANIPPALAALVMRCLEKRAADRPQSADDLVSALDQITTPSGGTAPTTAVAATTARTDSAPTARPRAGTWMGIAAAVVVLLGAVWLLVPRAAAGARTRSVAVLPMDVGSDTSHAYLADGLSNELTTKLSKVPGLAVRSYASAKSQRGESVKAAGKALDVASVLTASLSRSGTRLRVTASLVNTADENVIWSDTFEENDGDQFALQDRLVGAIAGALKISLSAATQPVESGRATRSAEAHDLVLRSLYAADQFTDASLKSAVTLAEAAIARDSSYAEAWSALANAWGLMADDFVRPTEIIPRMKTAIERALALDPTLADAHAQRGNYLYWYQWDLPGATRELEQALQIDSTSLSAAVTYTGLLKARSLQDSARRIAQRAARLNPFSREILSQLIATGMLRDVGPDSARALCSTLSRISVPDGVRCERRLLLIAGKRPEAMARMLADTTEEGPSSWIASRATGFLEINDTVRARTAFARSIDIGKRRYVREDMLAGVAYSLGDREQAVQWWLRAIESNSSQVVVLINASWWASLRTEPRLRAALAKRGITL